MYEHTLHHCSKRDKSKDCPGRIEESDHPETSYSGRDELNRCYSCAKRGNKYHSGGPCEYIKNKPPCLAVLNAWRGGGLERDRRHLDKLCGTFFKRYDEGTAPDFSTCEYRLPYPNRCPMEKRHGEDELGPPITQIIREFTEKEGIPSNDNLFNAFQKCSKRNGMDSIKCGCLQQLGIQWYDAYNCIAVSSPFPLSHLCFPYCVPYCFHRLSRIPLHCGVCPLFPRILV